jgi:hypothetical protein
MLLISLANFINQWIGSRRRKRLELPKAVGGIGAPGIAFAKLVGNIRKILHHPPLALNLFSPFSLLFVSAL